MKYLHFLILFNFALAYSFLIQKHYKSFKADQLKNNMKINPKAQYKINYKTCTQDSQHDGEKMNFVCLNQDCSLQSLICSICREEQHKGHITRPLKFYIEDLKKKYENEKKDFSRELERLE